MARLTLPPRARALLAVGLGMAVLLATVRLVGTAPFARGLAAVTPTAVLAAFALCALATSAAALRWHVVAAELGAPLGWRRAVVEYYRSQFLNSVLPGGVLGDVDRAWRHGGASRQHGAAARAVVVERAAGQLVQLTLTAASLLVIGAIVWLQWAAWGVGILAALCAGAVGTLFAIPVGRRTLRRESALVRRAFARPRAAATVILTSVVVFGAHLGTFTIAAHAVGVPGSGRQLLALALLALTAGSLPVNVGGFGPREASASLFTAASGLGASSGAAASTAFAVLSLIALLPGAAALIVAWCRRTRRSTPAPVIERIPA